MTSSLQWDAEIDTPATIAVIGGGPSGIEAALYARFLGYSVELFDSHKVGDSLVCWGDQPMPDTWRRLVSPLGLAALEAHEHPLPELDAVPTCEQYVEKYLLPIARCDLLYSSIQVRTPVLFVSRNGCPVDAEIPVEDRAEQEFRLLLRSDPRGEFSQVVDIVLDCSGGQAARSGLASGGGIPIGWPTVEPETHYGRQRILTRKRDALAGKKVLLFGTDSTAAANALDLQELAPSGTQLYWITQKQIGRELELAADNNPLLSAEQKERARQLLNSADGLSTVAIKAWGIEAIKKVESKIVATLQVREDETLDVSVDALINCAPTLARPSYGHTLDLSQNSYGASVTNEPHYYRLGQRSSADCTHTQLLEQIRHTFGLIGGRAELNLYQTVRPQSVSLD